VYFHLLAKFRVTEATALMIFIVSFISSTAAKSGENGNEMRIRVVGKCKRNGGHEIEQRDKQFGGEMTGLLDG
jgi:hypothetical protein